LLYICSSKLPNLTLSFWEQSLHNKTEIPTWLELNAFLTERHRSLEATDDFRPSGSSQSQPKASASSAASRRINSCETRVAYITASHEGISCCKSYTYRGRHHTLLHRGNSSPSSSNPSPRPRSRPNTPDLV